MTRKLSVILLLALCIQANHYVLADEAADKRVYAEFLQKYVSDGSVDYIQWKRNDFDKFEQYINGLNDVSLSRYGKDEKMAFWIDAYNALTIYAVLRRIPDNRLAGVFSVQMVPGFFDAIEYRVAGENITLNEIENIKLRGAFKDPRIHFVIVCASRSCPKIQDKIFTANKLEERLEEAARLFIRDKKRNRIDRQRGVAHLSQIFSWFSDDFIEHSGSIKEFIGRYLSPADREYIIKDAVKIKYSYYNWLVNKK